MIPRSVPSALPLGLRRRLRGPIAAALRPVIRAGAGKIGVILAYHGIQREEPETVEVVPSIGRERFRDHLRHLRRHYRVVPLPELVSAAAGRQRGEPFPLALTFDDDLGEHVDQAAPLLAAEGLPATFFLCGRDLLGDGEFWWETLQRAVDAELDIGELGPAAAGRSAIASAQEPRAIAGSIASLPVEAREAVEAKLTALVGEQPPERRLAGEQITELAQAGHTIGFHTRRHQALTSLDQAALRLALSDGRDELAKASGAPIENISYPHGIADARVADAARDEGFVIGLTAGGKATAPDGDPLRLDRLPADELSVAELAAAIVAAIARALR